MTDDHSDVRMARLERSNRLLTLAVIAALALNAFALLRPGAGPRGAGVEVLSRANASTMETYDNVTKKPKLVLTTSNSGATLWVYELQQDGRYARQGFGQ